MNKISSDETLLVFPCHFTLKVFGSAKNEFKETVITIIQQELPTFNPDTIDVRASQQGSYLSLNIRVYVESKAQLDRLYQALSSSPDILMVL